MSWMAWCSQPGITLLDLISSSAYLPLIAFMPVALMLSTRRIGTSPMIVGGRNTPWMWWSTVMRICGSSFATNAIRWYFTMAEGWRLSQLSINCASNEVALFVCAMSSR